MQQIVGGNQIVRLLGAALKELRRFMPYNQTGDRFHAFSRFLRENGRFPKSEGGHFVDHLYRLRSSGELETLSRQMVTDKEYAKLFINDVLAGDYTVPTHFILRSKEEVDSTLFPSACVIKPTHSSGQKIIRRDNAPIDLDQVKSFFSINHYLKLRESNYRYLERKVIVEPIMYDGDNLIELNIQCYQGRVKIMSVKSEAGIARELRDRDWNEVDVLRSKPKPKVPTPKPEAWDKMVWAAETLAARFPYIRVDMFTNGKEFKIGELTNCHMSGRMRFFRKGDEAKYSDILFRERVG